MNYIKLKEQSKIILKERKINIGLLIVLSLGFFIILYATLKTNSIYVSFVLLILFLLILFIIKCIKSNNLLLNQILSIEKNNALNKTYNVELHYPKVIIQQISQGAYVSRSPTYYAIKIVENKKNYYYFLEGHLYHDNKSIDKILKKFKGNIHIECYENTSIIKTIEGNPFFIHIRYGMLCD